MSRIHLYAACLVAAILLGVVVTAPPVPADPGGIPHVDGEVIIKWKDNATQLDKDRIRSELGGVKKKGWGHLKAELSGVSGMTVEEAINRYRNHPKIEYIEPNYVITINEIPNDPMFPQLYGLNNTGQTGGTADADIDAAEAWDVTTGSSSVLLGVIDTGVDYNHPDLAANVWTNPGEIPGNGIDDEGNGFIDDIHGWDFYNNDNDPLDDNGHGSHVSGTIGGVGNNAVGVAGVNWHVKIMGIKFLSASGSGSTDGAISSVEYATMMGVRLTSNSWGGGGFSQALLDAINAADAAGQLFIAAAGNSSANTDASPHYPSSYSSANIVAVAATDHNDNLASFSNYGATTVDLAAPGVNIVSTVPGSAYDTYSGTSMATPHVAGAFGLVFARFPAIGHLDAKNLILNFADPKASLAGKCLTGARLNAFFPIAEPDSIMPGAVIDLAATGAGSNWIDLAWTAPGDDGSTGTASNYVVKYSTAPIDAGNFDAAPTAPSPPDPGPAGTPETMTVSGLDFTTTYYFALKARDEFGNTSDMSNVASGTTLGAPDIDVTPTSLSETLITGGTADHILTVSNVGEGTLDFTVPSPDLVTMPGEPVVYIEYAKGAEDPGAGVLGAGGPDGFGYRWTDSDEPFGPTFSWSDISAVGTVAIASGDDSNAGPFAIGFSFPYYGVEYTQFRACTNGWLSFTSTSTAYSNSALPSAGAPLNMLAAFWDDLNVTGVGRVYYYNDGARLLVQWDEVQLYGGGGPYTFQAAIYPDGMVEFYYLSMGSPLNGATVGIQNAAGNDGLTVAYNTAYLHDSMVVRFQAVPQWLSVSPAAGTVWAPGNTTLDVHFDSAGLLGGTYEAFIRIMSNDPDEPAFSVPVTMVVIGAPDVDLSPLSYDFGQVFLGAHPTTAVLVKNPGTDVLHVSGVGIDNAAYAPDQTVFDVPPKGTVPVTVTFSPAVVGMYPATLTVTSDDPDEPTIAMTLAGEGVTPPAFSVTPTSLSSALFTGQAEVKALTLRNTGGAPLTYSVAVDLGEAPLAEPVYEAELAKGEEPAEPGILGSGGPDAYGYAWKDSDDPSGPVFNWVDISAIGTPIAISTDDQNAGPIPIGFNFPFYGNTFSTLRVCTNGWLSFTSTLTSLSNRALPTGAGTYPENLLAPFWDDLHFRSVQRARYHNDGTRFIVQYTNVDRYSTGSNLTFQVILYPNGTIVYQYLTMTGVLNSATVGIQNATKTDGLTVVNNANYLHNNMAIRFQASPDWLSAAPMAGTINPGGTATVNVTFNATDLFGGLYEGAVNITTNDPLAPLTTVPCDLTVTGAPDIQVTPASIDFGDAFVGYPELAEYVIYNGGTDNLMVTSIVSSDPAFVPDFTSVTLPLDLAPLGTAILRVRFNPPAATMYMGTLSIASNDPDTPSADIALSGSGLIAPAGSVDPTSLHSDLLTGETEAQQFMLYNTGGSDLEFSIQALTEFPAAPVPPKGGDAEKGMDEEGPGVLGSGGPDLFGYSWTDSDEPGGPTFAWTDISATGTPVFGASSDDSNTGPFPIGFNFKYYGNTVTLFRVCTNGWISFTSTATSYSNSTLPNATAPTSLLAPFWDDMAVDPAGGRQVFYQNDGTRLIVQFNNVRKLSETSSSYTFQVILYPSGAIVYQYLNLTGSVNSATVGIQNEARNDGLTVAYNAAYLHASMAIRIATTPDWLTITPASGTVPPGGSLPIDVMFDATGLFGGDYAGQVQVLSNDPVNGLLAVDATLHVTGIPRIGFSAASLDFGTVFVGYSSMLPLTVTNVGTDHLSVSSILPGSADYTVDVAALELAPLESQIIHVTFAPSADGDRSSALTFASNDPDSPHAVNLAGWGLYPPEMSVSPDLIEAAAKPGIVKTRTLTICNDGGSDLTYTATPAEITSATVEAQSFLEIPKGYDVAGGGEGPDPRPGILGSGGPDAFGYRWVDSDDPGGPTFGWVDVSGVGTPIPFGGTYRDDGNSGPLPIGFAFPFYGNSFTTVNACTNGWLSFTSTLTSYSNQPLPNAASGVPENLLAAIWDDMVYDESDGSSAWYHYDGTRAIFQFNNMRRIGTFTGPFYSYEFILYPNGNVLMQYQTLGATVNSCTVGIQNAARNDGLTVAFNAAYLHTGLAILYSARPAWLSVAPESGTIPAGECAEVTVTLDATALAAGDYFGTITVAGNDPANPSETTDVVFHVGTVDAAWFDIDPNTLNLTSNGNWITGRVELPMGYDPNDIVIETVMLNDAVFADPGHFTIQDYDDNGTMDAQFKFDRAAVEAVLAEGDSVEICVCGEIRDTIYFVACTTIRAIRPHVNSPQAGEVVGTGEPLLIEWSDPEGWHVDYAVLMYSPDDGVTWNLVADNVSGTSYAWTTPADATQHALIRVFVVDVKGVMGYDTVDGSFTVGAAILGGETPRPDVYALYQNAPNPFLGATRIKYDLPEASGVSLRIFDVSGRIIRVLEDGSLPAGSYEAAWDGRDSGGREVASGIYFYRLETDRFTAVKRMFLER